MSDYTPQILGFTSPPEVVERKPKTGTGRRGPGRFYLHGGERSIFVRRVIASIPAGQAVVLQFDSLDDLELFRLMFHNVDRGRTAHYLPMATKRLEGLRLKVWRREEVCDD
jgi:hypothetical protein